MKLFALHPVWLTSRQFLMLPYLVLLLLSSSLFSPATVAQQVDCGDELALQQSFTSGASWSLCTSVNDHHGLEVSSVYFRAPGDTGRRVMTELHLGQVLLHYHDSPLAEPQLNPAAPDTDESLKLDTISLTEQTCEGERLGTGSAPDSICAIIKQNRTLAKYAQRPSLQSKSWELTSAFLHDNLVWTVAITFTEDGQIRPAVRVSGRASRNNTDSRFAAILPDNLPPLTRATVLANWRMVFSLDSDAPDRIEQFDFPLQRDLGNRRPMQITPINTEALRTVDRETFRGWRVVDASGAGYYLDPANSGFAYSSRSENWAQFDIAFTRLDPCERYALLNRNPTDMRSDCGSSLDDFVNGESLIDEQAVIWYSQMRNMDLSIEDWPVISELGLSFDLLPFDWTAQSPFELVE